MGRNGWLEQHTRIPFAGIVAMVIVVAVVAVFLKLQMDSLFPDSEVTVRTQEEAGNTLSGMATASFQGMRKIDLQEKNRLTGNLHQRDRQLNFRIDSEENVLVLEGEGRKEEIILEGGEGFLSASFEFNGRFLRTDVFPGREFLFFIEPGRDAPVKVELAYEKSFEGTFDYREKSWTFQYYPAGSYVVIDGWTEVKLVRKGEVLLGTWFESGKSHPIRVDPSQGIATIEEVW